MTHQQMLTAALTVHSVPAEPGFLPGLGLLGLKHNRTFLKIRLGVGKPGPGLCEPAMPCWRQEQREPMTDV